MVRRYRRSIYDELDELRASMDYLYQLALEPVDNPLLLPGDTPDIVCQYLHNLNAEVAEHDDFITVTMDTVPGIGELKISVTLQNKNTLKITCERNAERTVDEDGNCLLEMQSSSEHHVIPLPCPVKQSGAKMNFKFGVLDIQLKKDGHCR